MDHQLNETSCAEVHDDLAEFALGVLDDHRRSTVAAHVERCASCAAEVASLARTLDALLDTAPEIDPPAGFAERTVALAVPAAVQVGKADAADDFVVPIEHLRARRGRRIASVAALVLVLGAGIGLGSLLTSGSTAPAPTTGVLTSALHSVEGASGTAVLTPGGDGWLVVSLYGAHGHSLRCIITLTNGTHRDLGTFTLSNGWASWAAELPVPASSVAWADVIDHSGSTVASASFRA